MQDELFFHENKVPGVIRHQAKDPTGLEFPRRNLKERRAYQTSKPMTPLWPGIRKRDVERVEESIRDQEIKRFLPPPSPDHSIENPAEREFPIRPPDAVGESLDPREKHCRMEHSALCKELALRGTEIALNPTERGGLEGQFLACVCQPIIGGHSPGNGSQPRIVDPPHGIRRRSFPDGGAPSRSASPRRRSG